MVLSLSFSLSFLYKSLILTLSFPFQNTFCAERKPTDKYGINSDKFVLMNEIGEVAAAILDARVVSVINKFESCIDYIHISDQYSGPKNPE